MGSEWILNVRCHSTVSCKHTSSLVTTEEHRPPWNTRHKSPGPQHEFNEHLLNKKGQRLPVPLKFKTEVTIMLLGKVWILEYLWGEGLVSQHLHLVPSLPRYVRNKVVHSCHKPVAAWHKASSSQSSAKLCPPHPMMGVCACTQVCIHSEAVKKTERGTVVDIYPAHDL